MLPRSRLFVLQGFRPKKLQGDGSIELGVLSLVDHTHATFAELIVPRFRYLVITSTSLQLIVRVSSQLLALAPLLALRRGYERLTTSDTWWEQYFSMTIRSWGNCRSEQ
jgi:hypothetical protein